MNCTEGFISIRQLCVSTALLTIGVGAFLTIIGWIVGWLARVAFENRKVKQERAAKRDDVQRQAVELALRWIDPMTLAITRVESVASAFLFGRVDEDHFRRRWPSQLGHELKSLELPAHLRPYLPDSAQQRGVHILRMFDQLHYSILEADRTDLDQAFEKMQEVFALGKAIDELRSSLVAAHRATLE